MEKLSNSIDKALELLENYQNENNISNQNWTIQNTRKVLVLLKNSTLEKHFDIRVLRAMKDIYVVSFRNFEGTLLYFEICKINELLKRNIDGFNELEPLGIDFDKGNPI